MDVYNGYHSYLTYATLLNLHKQEVMKCYEKPHFLILLQALLQ
ncbi:hypothetical protein BPJM79_100090 [Bacillus pumilus]